VTRLSSSVETLLRTLAFAAFSAAGASVPFLEESHRAEWDRGCRDYPTDFRPFDVRTSKESGQFRVLARLVLRPEKGETLADLLTRTTSALGDPLRYPAWVLPGINDSPDGGHYFVTVDSLRPYLEPAVGHGVLTGDFGFKILWFARQGTTSLVFRTAAPEPLPGCPAFADVNADAALRTKSAKFVFRMVPRPDLLDWLISEIWVFPRAKDVELRLRLAAKPASLVYELMPEALVRSQLENRGRRLFENFVDFRRLGAVEAAAKKH
jgi:hypothetical protein